MFTVASGSQDVTVSNFVDKIEDIDDLDWNDV